MPESSRPLAPGRFFGSAMRHGEVGGFRWSEVVYAPELRLERHAHALPYVSLVLAGGYVEQIGSERRRCVPRSVVIHAAGEEHADRFERAGGRVFNVELPIAWLDATSGRAGLVTQPSHLDGGAAAVLALRIRRELADADDLSALSCEGLLLELLAESARARRRDGGDRDADVRRARWLDDVRARLAERSLRTPRLSELAHDAGVHPSHLARAFRQRFGETVGGFARRARFEQACRRVAAEDVPLARIAQESGYADQAHLTREFRRFGGTTPARYRAAARAR